MHMAHCWIVTLTVSEWVRQGLAPKSYELRSYNSACAACASHHHCNTLSTTHHIDDAYVLLHHKPLCALIFHVDWKVCLVNIFDKRFIESVVYDRLLKKVPNETPTFLIQYFSKKLTALFTNTDLYKMLNSTRTCKNISMSAFL